WNPAPTRRDGRAAGLPGLRSRTREGPPTPSADPHERSRLVNGITLGIASGIAGGALPGLAGIITGEPPEITLSAAAFGSLLSTFNIILSWAMARVRYARVNRPFSSPPGTDVNWSPTPFIPGAMKGFLFGAAYGLSILGMLKLTPGSALESVKTSTLVLFFGISSAITLGIAKGFQVEGLNADTAIDPKYLISQDRKTFAVIYSPFSITSGIIFGGLAYSLFGIFKNGFISEFSDFTRLSIGVTSGVMLSLQAGLLRAAWSNFAILQAYLTARHKTPRNLMAFLQDARQRGVLRQVGAVYQFRHIDLQRHLAQQPWPPAT
ncbi:hypothetical protein L7D48_26450, partial [Streptomyces sp. S1A]|nr:hypothetical protein [Streptomyces sp. ICN903]